MLIHRGESDTVSLPGWQAALSPRSERKPIWQITSSRQSAHPPLPWPALSALSWSLLISLYLSASLPSSSLSDTSLTPTPPPPRVSLTLVAPLHAHIESTRSLITTALLFCLPGRNGGSQLSIFMSLALQVNCLRDSVGMNIRFEARGLDKKLDERDDREKKKMKCWRKRWPCSPGPVSRLPLSATPLLSSPCLSLSLFIFTLATLSSPSFANSLFLHTHSPLNAALMFFLSHALRDDSQCGRLILLNKDQ